MSEENHSTAAPQLDPTLRKRANIALAKYGLARLGLFLALTALIAVASVLIDAPVPLVMSALLALIVAFPLSMLVFKQLRIDATESVAAHAKARREHKEWVKRELEAR